MEYFKKSILLFAAMLTLLAGAFPPNSVICQAVNGEMIIEGACNCESEEPPPCCSEDSCHEDSEITEEGHGKALFSSDECFDTLISVESYTEQDVFVLSEQPADLTSFNDFISLIAGLDFPIDVGEEIYSDPPDLIPARITLIKSTVLII